MPLAEVERAERTVAAVQHRLRMTLEQQRQRASGRANINRLPEAVEHQNMLIKHRVHSRSIQAKLHNPPASVNAPARWNYLPNLRAPG